jgi:transposase-like protein
MSDFEARTFSRAFKLKAIERMAAGENVSALSRELTVKREVLYRWRAQHPSGGGQALRERRGRPTVAEAQPIAAARGPAAEAADLAQARRQIASCSARSASSSWTWIFSKKPCGTSRRHAG